MFINIWPVINHPDRPEDAPDYTGFSVTTDESGEEYRVRLLGWIREGKTGQYIHLESAYEYEFEICVRKRDLPEGE